MEAVDKKLADDAFREIEALGAWLQDQPTHTIWFQNTLICVLSALLREYRSLTVGLKKSTPLLAWACRNMLELNICTKYILLKGSNAKDFADDMWIDAIEVFVSFRDWIRLHGPGVPTPELDLAIADFQAEKAKRGITRGSYLKTHKMATVVNFGEEYMHMNKVASKLLHATAFSVLGSFDEGEVGLKPILFNQGVRFGVEAGNTVRRYVNNNGVEPPP